MAKTFAPRVSKRERKTVDMSGLLTRDLYSMGRDELLKGAELVKLQLKDITVKEQVRTKFNEKTLKELGTNIKENGLVQPLVVHREMRKGFETFVLICGERRYRAMTLMEITEAPCFVLSNKTEEELMSIQFSENSAREELHYIDKADGIGAYQKATGFSERKIQNALGISKSEVHRGLLISKLDMEVKEAAKQFNIEKYVLLEWDALEPGQFKDEIKDEIVDGRIVKRSQLKRMLAAGQILKIGRKTPRKKPVKKNVSAAVFLKAMKSKSKDMDLDPETMAVVQKLMEEAKDVIDLG